jgi:hypothetical protein
VSDPTPPQVSLLRCLKCGNTVEARQADLMRMLQTGWPKCCDETMALFSPADMADVVRTLTPPASPGLPSP